mgnify:CR=1 FL=1
MPKPPHPSGSRPAAPRSRTPAKPAKGAAAPASDSKTSGERIAKVLARAGIASRREAEAIILAGRVRVNGKPVDTPALNITARDRVTVDGQPLAAPEPARLWLYHKPAGLVTTARDEKGRQTVFDALPPEMPRVMSVGRLDLNSEGLLLLTNDGELKRKLELPATGWLRKYRVRLKGAPQDTAFEPLRKGITVEGEHFQPMSVVIDRQQGANAWVTVGLREGRNREIRRAMEALGFQVNRLIRISYGPFQLGDLAAGAIEEIRPRVLRDQLGIAPEEAGEKAARRAPGPKKPGTGRAGPTRAEHGKSDAGKPPQGKATPRSWGQRSHGGARNAPPAASATPEGATGQEARKPRSWGSKSARASDRPGTPTGPNSRKPR